MLKVEQQLRFQTSLGDRQDDEARRSRAFTAKSAGGSVEGLPSEADIKRIFGNARDLQPMSDELLAALDHRVGEKGAAWGPGSMVSDVLVQLAPHLGRAYREYSSKYSDMVDHLATCKRTFSRFDEALAALAGGQLSFTQPSGERQQVALVQGNIPQDLKWLATMREETRDIYAGLTDGLPEDTLVIWPESAMIEFYQDIRGFVDGEGEAVAAKGGALITGLPWRDQSRSPVTYHNSIAVVGTHHDNGVYHKQKLVPFGEYVPLQGLLRGLIPFFDLAMSSFTPGRASQPNLHALDQEIAPFICYEILYPDLVAERSAGADVLLTISNDAWFGTSAGPLQHFQMTRLRALETGRWLLRGTNNGVTAVVDPHGRVVERLPQFERDVLIADYQPRQGSTPFMVAGAWPTLLLALAFVVLGRGRRARSLLDTFPRR